MEPNDPSAMESIANPRKKQVNREVMHRVWLQILDQVDSFVWNKIMGEVGGEVNEQAQNLTWRHSYLTLLAEGSSKGR